MGNNGHDVTRRQFLNYTLMGVGGFMAAGVVMPMARFAVDPLLKAGAEGRFTEVDLTVDDLTNEPQSVTFKVEIKDGWNETEESDTAFLYLDENEEIVALSNVCTHLGCNVDWESNPAYPNQFYCPCHAGRYEKDGTNIPGTPPPAPLALYEVKVEGNKILLGQAQPRGGA